MKNFIASLKENMGGVAIGFLVLVLAATNYKSGAWLSGWDNLHPEFNFAVNIKRSLHAVWQEYQGLGLLGGMGHASDLPRQLALWVLSPLFPDSLLRWFYHLLMLLAGGLGAYFLLKNFILKGFNRINKELASLAGAFFYLLNLATLQMFYVPFEAYSAHFGFLPWLFLAFLDFLEKGSAKSLLLLVIVNFLSLTQGYVATYFVVYAISLALIAVVYLWKKAKVREAAVASLVIFSINAFWLLPNLYFVFDKTDINVSAKINEMMTQDAFLRNKKYGNLANTTLLKGFWFDNQVVDADGDTVFMLQPWVDHLEKPGVSAVGYFLFLLSLWGIVFAWRRKLRKALIFLLPLGFAFLMLSVGTPVLSLLGSLVYKLPLFSQIFRFPFTKFAILAALGLSIFYALGYLFLFSATRIRLFKALIALAFLVLPVLFLYPAFQGNLFYERNRAHIPREYFRVFDYFKNQKNGRIANFPQPSFWGWNFYKWGYSGSGLLWYGIEQPILDRAFDVWSAEDENYYWEISYALYSQDQRLFENVLEKYQISWLLVDGNIVNPSSPKALYFDELEKLAFGSNKISLAREFGKIKIYKVALDAPVSDFVFLAQGFPVVGSSFAWNNHDRAFSENSHYLVNGQWSMNNGQSIIYPFQSLFTGRGQEDLDFEVEDKGDFYVFRKTFEKPLEGYFVEIPEFSGEDLTWVNPENLAEVEQKTREIFFNGQRLEVIIPKVGGFYSGGVDPVNTPYATNPENCNQKSLGEVKNEAVSKNGEQLLRLRAVNANNCSISLWLANLPHKFGYLVTVEGRNVKGKSLLFWLENTNSRRADIETYLPREKKLTASYLIQPPMEDDGVGYTLHVDNISIGDEETVNDIGRIEINPIPYDFLKGIVLRTSAQNATPQHYGVVKVRHPNPAYYEVELGTEVPDNSVLVLSQAYHEGWRAYEGSLFGSSAGEHVLVNNWANGWLLSDEAIEPSSNKSIIIFYVPQLLEYLGFALLLLPLGYLLILRRKG